MSIELNEDIFMELFDELASSHPDIHDILSSVIDRDKNIQIGLGKEITKEKLNMSADPGFDIDTVEIGVGVEIISTHKACVEFDGYCSNKLDTCPVLDRGKDCCYYFIMGDR